MSREQLLDLLWKIRNCSALTTLVTGVLAAELAKETPKAPWHKDASG